MSYPRRYIEGDGDRPLRVFVLREGPDRTVYALRVTLIPVGLPYWDLGKGWGGVELEPWESVPDGLRQLPSGG